MHPIHVPTLTTTRLTLVPPDASHEALYRRFYTDADASRAYGGPLTPAAASDRLAHDAEAWSRQGFGVWVLRRTDRRDFVGVCGFWQGPGWPRELTWWLLPEARGEGLAYEASGAAVAHAYRHLGWDSVETYMNDENGAARALVLKLGGVAIRRQAFPDGLERHVYRIPAPTPA